MIGLNKPHLNNSLTLIILILMNNQIVSHPEHLLHKSNNLVHLNRVLNQITLAKKIVEKVFLQETIGQRQHVMCLKHLFAEHFVKGQIGHDHAHLRK